MSHASADSTVFTGAPKLSFRRMGQQQQMPAVAGIAVNEVFYGGSIPRAERKRQGKYRGYIGASMALQEKADGL